MDQEGLAVIASIVVTSLVKGLIEYQNRKKDTVHLATKIDQNTDVSVAAFKEANNFNLKTEALKKAATSEALTFAHSDVILAISRLQSSQDELRRMFESRGSTGATGETGAAGPQGETGPQGEVGPKGKLF